MNAERLTDARDLIEHVLERFHEAHRRNRPRIVALARDVEAGGGPAGFVADLAEHTRVEEERLFLMFRRPIRPGAGVCRRVARAAPRWRYWR